MLPLETAPKDGTFVSVTYAESVNSAPADRLMAEARWDASQAIFKTRDGVALQQTVLGWDPIAG